MLLSQLIQSNDDLPREWGQLDVSGLTADSREVEPGFMFAALPGSKTDGARFVRQAVERGAVAVIAPQDAGVVLPPDIALVAVQNPRQLLARCAARFYGAQPEIAVAVTGTNGKTSVVSFVRQIWEALGHRAASLGTVGFVTPDSFEPLIHTTPEPVTLHRMLRDLTLRGVQHLAAEVSSHGLAQHRADGVQFAAAAFTNISRDHLDYHASFDEYFGHKMRLFSELLHSGAAAVINADNDHAERVLEVCRARGLDIWSVGKTGERIVLAEHAQARLGHDVVIAYSGERFEIHVPLVGDFQMSNALMAAGLVLATGSPPAPVFRALESLTGAKGRLELVARMPHGALVFIDYAHTPDALRTALGALRPFAAGRLVVVFGCGGDRDKGKRRLMGEAASEMADLIFVTDDNPRTEDAASIRSEILEACPDATEIGNRAEAIAAAIGELRAGDILIVAGKGHESGQTIGTRVLPFSDHDVVRGLLVEGETHA